jgi:hypothetical protein
MPQPDDKQRDVAEEVMHVTSVANAVREAMKFDALQIARGLIAIPCVMAGDDPTARTTIGKEMIAAALELDPHLASVRWQ